MREIPTKTTNPQFDRALRYLLQYHDLIDAMGTPMLNLGSRPKGLRTNKQWQVYLTALLTVQVIGSRNRWTHAHMNRQGRPVYLSIDIPPQDVRPLKK